MDMANQYLITFRSVTVAQKAERVLKNAGLFCSLQRTPKTLSERGCGYCLRLRERDGAEAVARLREHPVPYGKVYALRGDGMQEVAQ
jgi:hypothetical protein